MLAEGLVQRKTLEHDEEACQTQSINIASSLPYVERPSSPGSLKRSVKAFWSRIYASFDVGEHTAWIKPLTSGVAPCIAVIS